MNKYILSVLALFLLATGCAATQTTTEDSSDSAVDDVSAEETVVEPEASTDLSYVNEDYGFTLSFPAEWAGYTVRKDGNAYFFGLSGEDLFAVSVLTTEEWDNLPDNEPHPGYLGEKDGTVFAWSGSQDNSPSLYDRRFEAEDILGTFSI